MTKLVFDSVFDAIASSPEESADLQFRADMMLVLRGIFDSRHMNQEQIGKALGVPQPRVSELMCGKISKVSSDKLIRYLSLVGYRFQPTFGKMKGKSQKPALKCAVIKEVGGNQPCT